MAIQNQGSFLVDLGLSAFKWFARVNIAGYVVKAAHGIDKKMSTCANVALSQAKVALSQGSALFPHQTVEGGAVVLDIPPLEIRETCVVFCRNTPKAIEAMGLTQKTIDCSAVGISTAELSANICFKACSNALNVLKGVAIVSAIDTAVDAILDRIIQGNSVKHKALKLAIGVAIGSVTAGNIIPIVAGITASDALAVYGVSRGVFEALQQVGGMIFREDAPAEGAAQGAQAGAARAEHPVVLRARNVGPQSQRGVRQRNRR